MACRGKSRSSVSRSGKAVMARRCRPRYGESGYGLARQSRRGAVRFVAASRGKAAMARR